MSKENIVIEMNCPKGHTILEMVPYPNNHIQLGKRKHKILRCLDCDTLYLYRECKRATPKVIYAIGESTPPPSSDWISFRQELPILGQIIQIKELDFEDSHRLWTGRRLYKGELFDSEDLITLGYHWRLWKDKEEKAENPSQDLIDGLYKAQEYLYSQMQNPSSFETANCLQHIYHALNEILVKVEK